MAPSAPPWIRYCKFWRHLPYFTETSKCQMTQLLHISVADPGFPWGGGLTPKVGSLTYYFANFFAKNCMKMKEFGPPRGCASLVPPWIRQCILANGQWRIQGRQGGSLPTPPRSISLISMQFSGKIGQLKGWHSQF